MWSLAVRYGSNGGSSRVKSLQLNCFPSPPPAHNPLHLLHAGLPILIPIEQFLQLFTTQFSILKGKCSKKFQEEIQQELLWELTKFKRNPKFSGRNLNFFIKKSKTKLKEIQKKSGKISKFSDRNPNFLRKKSVHEEIQKIITKVNAWLVNKENSNLGARLNTQVSPLISSRRNVLCKDWLSGEYFECIWRFVRENKFCTGWCWQRGGRGSKCFVAVVAVGVSLLLLVLVTLCRAVCFADAPAVVRLNFLYFGLGV